MRSCINLNSAWRFTGPEGTVIEVNVPHTWNAIDGQDGGDDYKRCRCEYEKTFAKPAFRENERVYLHGAADRAGKAL